MAQQRQYASKSHPYPEKVFYFSIGGHITGFILLVFFISVFAFGAVTAYPKNLLACVIMSGVVLFTIYISITDLISHSRHILKKEPALILSTDTLIDNTNDLVCQWKDVKSIEKGDSSSESDSGYIILRMKAHSIPVRIAPALIRGKGELILRELKKYHAQASSL